MDRVLISSDLGALELRLEARPEWADTLERDARGLWLAVELPKPVSAIDRVLWPAWATRVAYDSFGLVAELALDEAVTMRLRWVPAKQAGRSAAASGGASHYRCHMGGAGQRNLISKVMT